MIYVDWLCNHGWKFRGKNILSCHLYGDTQDELINFGNEIGLKISWLQTTRTGLSHFDLTAGMRKKAVLHGTQELTKQNFRYIIGNLRREKNEL